MFEDEYYLKAQMSLIKQGVDMCLEKYAKETQED